MEALGDRLKKVREERGISIEQVSRETNIARKYLNALENEDFSIFPGETYIIGFLSNYAEYLSLDSGEMVSLYRNLKLQEQPSPMEELIAAPPAKKKPILLILILLLVLAGAGFAYFEFFKPQALAGTKIEKGQTPGGSRDKNGGITKTSSLVNKGGSSSGNLFKLKDEMVEKFFKEGTAVSVPVGDTVVNMTLRSVSDNAVLTYPRGKLILSLGISKSVDLDGDGKNDVTVTVNDLDKKSKGAVIRFDLFVAGAGKQKVGSFVKSSDGNTGNVAASGNTLITGSAGTPSREKAVRVVLSKDQREPFLLNMLFRGYCLIRYTVDNGERKEQYFKKGETLRLDVTNRAELWISNSGALSARLGGKDVAFGRSGEVSVYSIGWVKNVGTGLYDLQLVPVY